jgi:hypothetical protein
MPGLLRAGDPDRSSWRIEPWQGEAGRTTERMMARGQASRNRFLKAHSARAQALLKPLPAISALSKPTVHVIH